MFANTAEAQVIVDKMSAYGVQAEGEVVGSEYHSGVSGETMSLRELVDAGGRITRVRLLTGVWPGRGRIADISYIHGTLPSGKIVHLNVDCSTSMLRDVKKDFIEWAKREGVFAKGCGLLDENNWSILHGS